MAGEDGKIGAGKVFIGSSSSSLSFFRRSHSFASSSFAVYVNAAGLSAGATEAIMVVCPMEVVKIRLQAQLHSLSDPLEVPKYRNAAHAAYRIVSEEGIKTLYRGVGLTALRQATNQVSPDLSFSSFLVSAYSRTRRVEGFELRS